MTITAPAIGPYTTFYLKGALSWLNKDFGVEGKNVIDLSFLNSIIFIAVIAAMVQLVEMTLDKFSQTIYQSWDFPASNCS